MLKKGISKVTENFKNSFSLFGLESSGGSWTLGVFIEIQNMVGKIELCALYPPQFKELSKLIFTHSNDRF